ncbi:hypothetical protein LTR78_009766 [Recurvomyces mirabilis]|uniref:Uncharacterized protein n=1 Tax=Recurvomyces mirabilis TaxID=574656 RepID=A0AAE0WH83_9PEZI|nr:hypothetical protein LTR78_009766 [Recurvomyces mirabilis]KAK5158184.1 hypothetical protein LTS14_003202 [Recurvomyces mirabilis]
MPKFTRKNYLTQSIDLHEQTSEHHCDWSRPIKNTMLPPVPSDILTLNPKFSVLYQDLSHNRLQQDGTSKPDNKDLHKARTEAYKRETVRRNLQDIVYRGEALPDELRDLGLLIAATLGGEVAPDDLSIVEGELARLPCYSTDIAALLSKQFAESASRLSAVAIVGGGSHEVWPHSVAKLGSDVVSQHQYLRRSRSVLVDAAQELQDIHRQVLEVSVRVLEQVIHGAVARHGKATADHLAILANGISKKVDMHHAQLTQHIYTAEIQSAIRSALSTMKDSHTDVRFHLREAEERLAQYNSARGMKNMVKEYAELLAETRKVEAEIARLKGGM